MDNYEVKQRIVELAKIIYAKYSGVGGALHIVLDDENVETQHIQWCIDECIAKITDAEEKAVYTECAELLLKLSYSARENLVREYNYA